MNGSKDRLDDSDGSDKSEEGIHPIETISIEECEDHEENEGVFVNTIVSKNGQVLNLPEIHPPPDCLIQSIRNSFGCCLCNNRQTEDMIVCNRCNEEYHAHCLYGEEYDYNDWLCDGCVEVLSCVSNGFDYLRLRSEMIESSGMAPMGTPHNKGNVSIFVNRMKWLKSIWNDLLGSCVMIKMKNENRLGRVIFVDENRLLVYIVMKGEYWYESGWYALERGEVSILRDLLWMNDEEGLHICWLMEEVDEMIGLKEWNDSIDRIRASDSNSMNSSTNQIKVLDILRERVMIVNRNCTSKLRDWREHRLELEFSNEQESIRWEIRVRNELRSGIPLSVPRDHIELSGKEWLYKWIYVWSRQVDFPLGGWCRGVVLHYRSLTGKHFVCFERDDVPCCWLYLNREYVIMEGVCNEYVMKE